MATAVTLPCFMADLVLLSASFWARDRTHPTSRLWTTSWARRQRAKRQAARTAFCHSLNLKAALLLYLGAPDTGKEENLGEGEKVHKELSPGNEAPSASAITSSPFPLCDSTELTTSPATPPSSPPATPRKPPSATPANSPPATSPAISQEIIHASLSLDSTSFDATVLLSCFAADHTPLKLTLPRRHNGQPSSTPDKAAKARFATPHQAQGGQVKWTRKACATSTASVVVPPVPAEPSSTLDKTAKARFTTPHQAQGGKVKWTREACATSTASVVVPPVSAEAVLPLAPAAGPAGPSSTGSSSTVSSATTTSRPSSGGCPATAPSLKGAGVAARHSEEDIFQWVEERISKYQEANLTAIDVSGECPPFVQWKNLEREMTNKFACMSQELDSALKMCARTRSSSNSTATSSN